MEFRIWLLIFSCILIFRGSSAYSVYPSIVRHSPGCCTDLGAILHPHHSLKDLWFGKNDDGDSESARLKNPLFSSFGVDRTTGESSGFARDVDHSASYSHQPLGPRRVEDAEPDAAVSGSPFDRHTRFYSTQQHYDCLTNMIDKKRRMFSSPQELSKLKSILLQMSVNDRIKLSPKLRRIPYLIKRLSLMYHVSSPENSEKAGTAHALKRAQFAPVYKNPVFLKPYFRVIKKDSNLMKEGASNKQGTVEAKRTSLVGINQWGRK